MRNLDLLTKWKLWLGDLSAGQRWRIPCRLLMCIIRVFFRSIQFFSGYFSGLGIILAKKAIFRYFLGHCLKFTPLNIYFFSTFKFFKKNSLKLLTGVFRVSRNLLRNKKLKTVIVKPIEVKNLLILCKN